MNNGILNYQLPAFTGIARHDQSKMGLLRDGTKRQSANTRSGVDIQVRSGDYFVTLATLLDEISSDINVYSVRMELENIVSDLIYLQDNFTIAKSEPPKSPVSE